MKLNHCMLLKKQQLTLLEYFMLDVTARFAAVLDIQPDRISLNSRMVSSYL